VTLFEQVYSERSTPFPPDQSIRRPRLLEETVGTEVRESHS
jgi:hypothetical protein